ncbi:unnamed protein product, partial [Phaeothamnion confervicola]
RTSPGRSARGDGVASIGRRRTPATPEAAGNNWRRASGGGGVSGVGGIAGGAGEHGSVGTVERGSVGAGEHGSVGSIGGFSYRGASISPSRRSSIAGDNTDAEDDAFPSREEVVCRTSWRIVAERHGDQHTPGGRGEVRSVQKLRAMFEAHKSPAAAATALAAAVAAEAAVIAMAGVPSPTGKHGGSAGAGNHRAKSMPAIKAYSTDDDGDDDDASAGGGRQFSGPGLTPALAAAFQRAASDKVRLSVSRAEPLSQTASEPAAGGDSGGGGGASGGGAGHSRTAGSSWVGRGANVLRAGGASHGAVSPVSNAGSLPPSPAGPPPLRRTSLSPEPELSARALRALEGVEDDSDVEEEEENRGRRPRNGNGGGGGSSGRGAAGGGGCSNRVIGGSSGKATFGGTAPAVLASPPLDARRKSGGEALRNSIGSRAGTSGTSGTSARRGKLAFGSSDGGNGSGSSRGGAGGRGAGSGTGIGGSAGGSGGSGSVRRPRARSMSPGLLGVDGAPTAASPWGPSLSPKCVPRPAAEENSSATPLSWGSTTGGGGGGGGWLDRPPSSS